MKINTKHPDRIMVCGDIHALFYDLWMLINQKKPEILICAGDFGYWPGFKRFDEFLKNVQNGQLLQEPACKVYWIDGNHEDHHAILKDILEPQGEVKGEYMLPIEIAPNLFYCPRGSILDIPDGRRILFAGGAYSIDKHLRTPGSDWFPEETLSPYHVDEFFPNTKVDIVISHTCPLEWLDVMLNFDARKSYDQTQHALTMVLERYKPDLWYFAHWHHYAKGVYLNTKWEALNMGVTSGWWNWLETGGYDEK